METKVKILLTFFIAILIFTFLFLILGSRVKEGETLNLDGFAKCLSDKGVVMYGAYWCPHCQNEKKAFGDSFRFVSYVECTEEPNRCIEAKISGYPTWIGPQGLRLEGEQGLKKLSEASSCSIRASTP